jgi:negative regulator of flagellin synthesis FlgM
MIPMNQERKKPTYIRDQSFSPAPGQDMGKIFSILKITPDVREDRVAALKGLIEAGKYHVSGDDLAEKMIKEFLLELKG